MADMWYAFKSNTCISPGFTTSGLCEKWLFMSHGYSRKWAEKFEDISIQLGAVVPKHTVGIILDHRIEVIRIIGDLMLVGSPEGPRVAQAIETDSGNYAMTYQPPAMQEMHRIWVEACQRFPIDHDGRLLVPRDSKED